MAAGDLQAPTIPLLINNTIDPDSLNGEPLKTYAKYADPRLGDVLFQSWLGLAEDGTPVDVKDIPIDVDPDKEEPAGFLMEVANHFVQQLDKGQVFYSYFLERVTGEPREESKRIHFGIGKDGLLSAPQIKESHDLQLDADAIEDNITIAVVPYTVMSKGDVVTLFWKGELADGNPGPDLGPFRKELNDTDTDPTNNPGQVLRWTQITGTNVRRLRGGKITLRYEITYASSAGRADTVSAERTILVTPPAVPELPVPSVKDLVGSEINPGQFPEGIRVVVPIYSGIRVGDEVLVYGTRTGSNEANKHTVQYLKIDKSNIESGRIEVPIAAQWLLDNSGADVSLRYQYARPDAAGSSASLALSIRQPLVLPTPTVDHSVESGGQDQLDPINAFDGAYITIPDAATIVDGDEVTAFWKGFGASGSFETQTPSQPNPMKFKVPREVLPPNFGKIVEVTYRVAGQCADPPLKLYIRQLASHPGIVCDKAQIGSPATLKLSDIPIEGALLSVDFWSFISTDQRVRLWLTSSNITDRDIIAVRPLKPEEVTGKVKARLLKTDLNGIATNTTFTLRCSVSFDGGETTVIFNKPLLLKLLD